MQDFNDMMEDFKRSYLVLAKNTQHSTGVDDVAVVVHFHTYKPDENVKKFTAQVVKYAHEINARLNTGSLVGHCWYSFELVESCYRVQLCVHLDVDTVNSILETL